MSIQGKKTVKKTLNKFGSRLDRFGRRGFLGGSGAALVIGLPVLDVLTGRTAVARGAGTPRLLAIGAGSGMGTQGMPEWTPKKEGADYDLPRMLQGIKDIQSKVSIFSGLGIDEGANAPGDHGAGMAAMFTCVHPKHTHAETNDQTYEDPGKPFGLGISFDQVMAQQLGSNTRLPSMQLGLRAGSNEGDGPFAPIYLKNLSWGGETEPLAPALNAGAVFDQIFAGNDPEASAEENALRQARSKSILDYVAEEQALLKPTLGSADAERLDQFFTAVREVEGRLAVPEGQAPAAECAAPGRPAVELDYETQITTMSDLALLAFQCDVTRTISFQLSCYRNDTHYGFLNVDKDHHRLSHDKGRVEQYNRVCRWLADHVTLLMTKMEAVKETDGTLLDNSLVLFNNDCGFGNGHDHEHLPVMLGGSAGGKIMTGRHFVYERNTPCNSLYVTMLNALGVDIQEFGTKKSGPLAIG